jgi:hypothetical protein
MSGQGFRRRLVYRVASDPKSIRINTGLSPSGETERVISRFFRPWTPLPRSSVGWNIVMFFRRPLPQRITRTDVNIMMSEPQ